MTQQTRSLADRLRAAWDHRAPRPERQRDAHEATPEDFAARLRAAVQATRH